MESRPETGRNRRQNRQAVLQAFPDHPARTLQNRILHAALKAADIIGTEAFSRTTTERTVKRLIDLGVVSDGPHWVVTAAGFALLLAWHRRHPRRPWWRDWRKWEERRHEVRMRSLIDSAPDGWFADPLDDAGARRP
jgi:hypothetical protein